MASRIQLPQATQQQFKRVQADLGPFQTLKWAKDIAEVLTLVEGGAFGEAAFELGKLVYEISDRSVRQDVVSFISGLSSAVSTLTGIFDSLVTRVVNLPGALAELLADGFQYIGSQTETDLEDALDQATQTQGDSMAAFPVLTPPPACTTPKGQHKGICCAAYTILGASVASTGFTYTSCSGRTICLKCGIGTSRSTNPNRAGKPIFVPRRVSCGPAGCPVLVQGVPSTVI